MAVTQPWLFSMALLFIMRMCMSVNFSAVRNIRLIDYTLDSQTQRCNFQPKSSGDIDINLVPIYLIEFFLPALGGLFVDKYGELNILRIAGPILLLSGVYATAMEASDLMCHRVVYMLGLVPSCLAFGLGVAPLVATPMKLSHGRFGSPTPGLLLYYASAASGELLGFLPRYLRPRINVTWFVCVFPLMYIATSAYLRLDWTAYRRRVGLLQLDLMSPLPTWSRLLRYFILLAPLVLGISVIANVRGATYCAELNYYLLNCTDGNCSRVSCISITSGYNGSTLATLALLGLLYWAGRLVVDGRVHARFYAGALVLAVGKAGLIAWHLWAAGLPQQPDPGLVRAIYSGASVADGVANGLALASGYELMYRIAPACGKNLVMGFLFTVWATGACVTGLTVFLLDSFPTDGPVLAPKFGVRNDLYIAYVVMLIECLLMFVYYRCFSVRMSQPLMVVDEGNHYGPKSSEPAQPPVAYDNEETGQRERLLSPVEDQSRYDGTA